MERITNSVCRQAWRSWPAMNRSTSSLSTVVWCVARFGSTKLRHAHPLAQSANCPVVWITFKRCIAHVVCLICLPPPLPAKAKRQWTSGNEGRTTTVWDCSFAASDKQTTVKVLLARTGQRKGRRLTRTRFLVRLLLVFLEQGASPDGRAMVSLPSSEHSSFTGC